MTDRKSEAMTFDEWWTEWNRCRCGVSDHARISASNAWYRQQHILEVERTKHERVLQALMVAEKTLIHLTGEFDGYCETCSEFGIGDDEACKHYEKLAHVALAQIEELKK